jgi:hypothetical protein
MSTDFAIDSIFFRNHWRANKQNDFNFEFSDDELLTEENKKPKTQNKTFFLGKQKRLTTVFSSLSANDSLPLWHRFSRNAETPFFYLRGDAADLTQHSQLRSTTEDIQTAPCLTGTHLGRRARTHTRERERESVWLRKKWKGEKKLDFVTYVQVWPKRVLFRLWLRFLKKHTPLCLLSDCWQGDQMSWRKKSPKM